MSIISHTQVNIILYYRKCCYYNVNNLLISICKKTIHVASALYLGFAIIYHIDK